MQTQTGRNGRKWWLVGLALGLALVLRPGWAKADLTIDHITYTLGADLTENNVIVGVTAGLPAANLIQNAHTLTVNIDLTLGRDTGSIGTYSLSGTGTLSVSGDEYNGNSGSGTFTQSGGTHTVGGDLTLGYNATGSGSFSLSGGLLTVTGGVAVGENGSGTFTQTGGTFTVSGGTDSGLVVGYKAGSTGTYFLRAGSLSTALGEAVGYSGSGTFTQTGGTNTVNGLGMALGVESGASGTYNLINTGSLSVTGSMGEVVGYSGTGTFNQTGGTHTVTADLVLGANTTGHGTYNLSGTGSLSVTGYEFIAYSGSADFTQTGGTHSVGNYLFLGTSTGSSGTYNLSGGTLTALSNEIIGNSGTGTFTQSGGSHSVAGALVLGDQFSGQIAVGTGTYNLSGTGSLSVAWDEAVGLIGSGTFTQTGGTHTVGGTLGLVLGYNTSGTGTYNLSDTGNLSATNEYVGYSGSGTFTQTGGTNTVAGVLNVANGGGSSGTYNLQGGSLSAATINLNAGGTFNQTGGTLNFTTFTQSGGSATFTNLYMGRNAGDNTSYTLSGGSATAAIEYLGNSGTGTFTQSGGTHTVTNTFFLGSNAGSSGTYSLSDGSLSVTGSEYLGLRGSGTFTQSGGSHTVGGNSLTLGFASGASGAYSLSSGSLSVPNECIGDLGSGSFTQSGGTHTVSGDLILAQESGSSGTYNLSGGSLAVNGAAWLGWIGTGTFTQTGGTHTVGNGLNLGWTSVSSGSYNLSGGSLSVTGDEVIAYWGNGTFTQSGGTHTISQDLYVGTLVGTTGTNTGAYTLSGTGSLSVAGDEYIGWGGTGTFTQSGGTHTVTGSLYLALNAGSSGTYNLSGGSLTAGTINLNTGGIFNQTGGSLNATTFNQQGGEVQGSLENRGTFNYYSGTFSGRLLNYGTANLYAGGNTGFTAGNGLTNYSATALTIGSGQTLTLNGAGLDNQGTLAVNGTLNGSGPLVNNTTGTLKGTGTIQGNLTNRGTLSPGNSPGTLTIVGNYTQTASGTLQVQIASASSYSKLAVTGSASLNGTVAPILLGGYRPLGNQVFSGVVTATGGVSGTFSTLTTQFMTLFWRAVYYPDSVDLVVGRNYAIPGLNSNELGVANMLNSVAGTATGDLAGVLNAIDSLDSLDAIKNAYKQISPEKAGALPILGFANFYSQYRNLATRITNLRFGSPGMGTASGPGGSFNLSYTQQAGLMLAYNSSSLSGLITGKREAAPGERWGLFLDPNIVLGSRSTTVNQTGYDFTTAGFTVGADYRVRDDLLLGLATGYSHTGASFRGSGGSVENNSWPILAYMAYLPQNFYAFGALGYTLNLFDLNRQIAFNSINRTTKSSPTGNQFNLYGEAGYDLKLPRAVVTPMLSLAYSQIWVDGFTEGGAGALNLRVGPQSASSLQTGVGAKVTMPMKVKSIPVVPQFYATYQHEFSNNAQGLDARLSQGSSPFIWQTDRPGRNFAVVGGNLSLELKKNLNLRLDYNAEVGRKDYIAHNINVGLRFQF